MKDHTKPRYLNWGEEKARFRSKDRQSRDPCQTIGREVRIIHYREGQYPPSCKTGQFPEQMSEVASTGVQRVVPACHSEYLFHCLTRSVGAVAPLAVVSRGNEESRSMDREILRCTQNDKRSLHMWVPPKILQRDIQAKQKMIRYHHLECRRESGSSNDPRRLVTKE